ncbi:NADH-quinone oxidoreductase subunit NuoN [Mycobacterium sp. shizuoka-1]|uniref:NADH-quinone oxidoreductase subunit NuoN n=1 Tax=Mycobacterium sp. shizuoka-1 TaxID=2039281 RepID=UPI000C06373E|nr:NADH-quinone oxidoreductase subunit NuoN [Mycobacterium sp. shizuoka-1]GAY15234.1 NADH-quinone oxidoreductase subunit N [Mycobacterium sp. shizuoka-1]
MTAPSIEYGQLSPMLIVLGVAVTGVLVEAFAPRDSRYRLQLGLSLTGLAAALVAVVVVAGTVGAAVSGAVISDGPASFLQGTILVVGIASLALVAQRDSHGASTSFTPQASTVPGGIAEHTALRANGVQTEVFPLTMFAVAGMTIFVAAGDLLTMFIALEVFSLPLYLMCGLARRRRLLSQEAAVKYFLLGAFSSAFFLYGIALLYGYAGTLSLPGIAKAIDTHTDTTTLALLGTALITVGILFKVGAVPFHSWIPDVYQGAPTPITAFMAAATKIAAFGAMLRIFYVALPGLNHDWRPILSLVAMLTMAVGAVLAVGQTDLKRLLGYSAVAQAGFILTGVVAADGAALAATLFYLATYGVTTLGAFAVISLVRNHTGGEETTIASWAGLGRRHPVAAMAFALFLLAFAGIPLTSGFIGKFAVFAAAAHGGQLVLVLVGVIASAVTAFVYARVVVLMYADAAPTQPALVCAPGRLTGTTIGVAAVATLTFGFLPQPLLDLAHTAGAFFA